MINFTCPVCGQILTLYDFSYKCKNGHCFDRSRKGYVNLFQSKYGKASKTHGDDKVMIKARTRFLDEGFYSGLKECVCSLSVKYSPKNSQSPRVIDCGCGECYYTDGIFKALCEKGKAPEIMGVDISKEAVAAGFKRCRELKLAVGSVFHLPCEDEKFDLLINLFAPFCKEEYSRVLTENGYMIMAIPLTNHLWELKQAIYEKPYKNQVGDYETEGFELVEKREVKKVISLENNQQIMDLFSMTPYYYKTSHEDRKKLEKLERLQVQTEFGVLVYKKTGAV